MPDIEPSTDNFEIIKTFSDFCSKFDVDSHQGDLSLSIMSLQIVNYGAAPAAACQLSLSRIREGLNLSFYSAETAK